MSQHRVSQRLLVLGLAAAAYAAQFWPAQAVLKAGLAALGNPKYEGFRGMFLPHLLLYSTFGALVCLVLWIALWRAKILAAPALGAGHRAIWWGLLSGALAIAASLVVLNEMLPPGALHWVGIKPWLVAGNLFSNLFEEIVYRGFLFAAVGFALGPVAGAIISSLLFGFAHTQYPLWLQLSAAGVGLIFCWARVSAQTVLAPWIGHQVLDTVIDAILA